MNQEQAVVIAPLVLKAPEHSRKPSGAATQVGGTQREQTCPHCNPSTRIANTMPEQHGGGQARGSGWYPAITTPAPWSVSLERGEASRQLDRQSGECAVRLPLPRQRASSEDPSGMMSLGYRYLTGELYPEPEPRNP